MMKKYIVFSFCLVSFFFRAEEISIEELVSVGSNINQSKDLISSTIDIIDSEELERQSEKDVLSVLSNTLAIDTSRYGGFGQISSVFLRGTNSNHTIFQVNGVKINPSTAGGASIYSLDADVISKIEIGSGAFSSIHGSEAIGGIVNISTIKQDIAREPLFPEYSLRLHHLDSNYLKLLNIERNTKVDTLRRKHNTILLRQIFNYWNWD